MAPKVDKNVELTMQIGDFDLKIANQRSVIDKAAKEMKSAGDALAKSRKGWRNFDSSWSEEQHFLNKKAAWEKEKNKLNKLKVDKDKVSVELDEYVETSSSTDAKKALTSLYKNGMSKWSKDKFTEGKNIFWDTALKKMANKTFRSPYKEGDPSKGLDSSILAKHEDTLSERGEVDVKYGTDKSREGLSEKSEAAQRAKFANAASAAKKSLDSTMKSMLAGQGMAGVGASKAMGIVKSLMKDQSKQQEAKIASRDYQAKQQGLGEAASKYNFETHQKEVAQDDLGEFQDSQRRYAIDQAAGKRQFHETLDVHRLEGEMNVANMVFGDPKFTSADALASNIAKDQLTPITETDSQGREVTVGFKNKDGEVVLDKQGIKKYKDEQKK